MHTTKKILRKVAAGATGLAVLGMTLGGAVAADTGLDAYPAQFDSNTVLVVGGVAASEDLTARENIASSLGGETIVLGGGDLTFGDGEYEDVPMGTALTDTTNAFSAALDNNDDLGLVEGELQVSTTISDVSYEGDYEYHEEIFFTSAATTGTALSLGEKEMGDALALVFDEGSVGYNFTFEDDLSDGNFFANATSDYEIEINFLGKDLTIRSADADSLTAVVGDRVNLNAGDVVKVGEHTVKFVRASTTEGLFEIDGETISIDSETTKNKNGVELFVDALFDEEDPTLESAVVVIGGEAVKTYSDNEAYWDEDEDRFLWEWMLAGLDGATPTIGVELGVNMEGSDDSDEVDHDEIMALGLLKDAKGYLAEGDYLCLPHKYACVFFEEVLGDTEGAEIFFDASDETEDLYNAAGTTLSFDNWPVLKIVSSGMGSEKGLTPDGGEETDALAIRSNGTALLLYTYDHDDAKEYIDTEVYANNQTYTELFEINNDDLIVSAYGYVDADDDYFNLTIEFDDANLTMQGELSSGNITHFGDSSDDDTSGYEALLYSGESIMDWDDSVYTINGVLIQEPKGQIESDKVRIMVPNDDEFKVGIRVAMPTGGTETTVTTNTAYSNMLDTEVTDSSMYNVITVGGPAVNMVSAELLGLEYPAVGADSGIPEGKAILELMANGDNWALVVAGWEAENTLAAASLLENYLDYDFGGSSAVTVEGTVAAASVAIA